MKKLSILIMLCCYFSFTARGQSAHPFARFPSISPDGQSVAFSYEGDIWTVPVKGGEARRMTVNDAYESHPQWSPKGNKIAFNSNRNSNSDLFELEVNGRGIRELTHHSASDELTGWTPDGRLIFTTKRIFNKIESDPEIQTISSGGGTPTRFFNAFGEMARMTPNGRYLIFVRGNTPVYRKRYRGSANRDLWLYDTENETYRQLTDFKGSDIYPRLAGNNSLYFLSERSGTLNIYKAQLSADGEIGAIQQLTDLKNDGVRYFDVSNDGSRIIFESKTALYSYQPGNSPQKLPVDVSIGQRYANVEHKTFRNEAEDFAVSPSGDYLAFVEKGEIFIKHNDPHKKRSVQVTHDFHRDLDVTFLNDSTLIFASDRKGQYDLYSVMPAEKKGSLFGSLEFETKQLTDSKQGERHPVVSPDGNRVVFNRGRGNLVVAPVNGRRALGRQTTLYESGWAGPKSVTWSPDSKWLAYARPNLNYNDEIYIQPADQSREPVNVSKDPRPNSDPVWSPDGKKLAFLSSRNNGDSDIWFAWLDKKDQELSKLEWEKSKNETTTASDSSKTPDVTIDFDGIYKRLRQVTSLPGNESDIAISADGKTFYFVTNRDSRQNYNANQNLYKVKWDGTGMKALTENGPAPYNIRLIPKMHAIYFMQRGGKVGRFSLKKHHLQQLPFTADMSINHQKQRNEIFEEAWRKLDVNFADPDFHGQDWQQLHDHYKPWAMKASSDQDFKNVMNMMLGEMNASHMGFYMSDRAETNQIHTGLLGIAVEPVSKGVEITHIVPDSPADREISSLKLGDIIVSVDGQSVAETDNFYHLLEDNIAEPTRLGIQNDSGDKRQVVIEPTRRLNEELYNEWVQQRKKLTKKYSNGRLGYFHIEGMNWTSFERFERDLIAAGKGKEGIVIDVRYNGGGWTTDYLLTALNYRQHAYTIPRGATPNLKKNHTKFRSHYPFGERLPFAAWTGPSIALVNHTSYSNAEIFSHAFKSLDYGTLVGEPSFGAVFSVGGARLMGGAYVRLPFRNWYVKATDENMELGPAVPDMMIDNAPDYRVKGDAQLKGAVNKLLQQIDTKK